MIPPTRCHNNGTDFDRPIAALAADCRVFA
jgi:hypothetical protein